MIQSTCNETINSDSLLLKEDIYLNLLVKVTKQTLAAVKHGFL